MDIKKSTARMKPAATTVARKEDGSMQPHELILSPDVQGAIGVFSWGGFAGEPDLPRLIDTLREQIKKLQAGDMSSVEAMLYGQAKTLETLFTALARRASKNDGLKQFQVNLTLALKAQAQCRATLEALAEIKNPRPVSFVRQSNVTTGPQQVNNTFAGGSEPAGMPAGGGNSEPVPSKLLEADHGQRMDIRAQGAASRNDPHLEAVGAVHRT
jgi:hypothetical protein